MDYQIIRQAHFLDIPSGSGIEIWQDKLYIMGDDSRFLYVLDNEWNLRQKLPIWEPNTYEDFRIAKKDKPDLEAMTIWTENGQSCLWLIGSGSKSPQRDFSYKMYPDTSVEKRAFTHLYENLRKLPSVQELNIEAAIQWEATLILFQRGGTFQPNALILVNGNEGELLPIELPLINNVQAGISGAAYWAERDILLVCASAEATTNAYDDGEICGSLMAEIKDFSQKMKKKQLFLNDFVILTEIPKQKIESIAIAKVISDTLIKIFAVADNDDGSSFLFEIALSC